VASGLKIKGICGWGVSPAAQGAKISALATPRATCWRIALFELPPAHLRRMFSRSHAIAATEGLPRGITDGDGTSLTAVAFLRAQNPKRMGAVDSLRRAREDNPLQHRHHWQNLQSAQEWSMRTKPSLHLARDRARCPLRARVYSRSPPRSREPGAIPATAPSVANCQARSDFTSAEGDDLRVLAANSRKTGE